MSVGAYPTNNTEYYAEDAQKYTCTRTTGVFSSDNNFVVTANGGMEVAVSKGLGWMNYDDMQGCAFWSTETETFVLDTADGSRTRIDSVVGRLDRLMDTAYIYIKKGTPASNPQPPLLQKNIEAYEIALADIMVSQGVLSIVQGNINNSIKLDENRCGVMRDGVTGIPTQQLYDDWWAWFSQTKGDAEAAAEAFIVWIEAFKSENEAAFNGWFESKKSKLDIWFSTFTTTNITRFNEWYTAFTDDKETEWGEWIQHLKDELSENQAANLQFQIDEHKETSITSPNGVHKMRVTDDGKFQFNSGTGWVTMFTAPRGYAWSYIRDVKQWTWSFMRDTGITWNNLKTMFMEE